MEGGTAVLFAARLQLYKCHMHRGSQSMWSKHRETVSEMLSANKALERTDCREATALAQPTRGMIYLS